MRRLLHLAHALCRSACPRTPREHARRNCRPTNDFCRIARVRSSRYTARVAGVSVYIVLPTASLTDQDTMKNVLSSTVVPDPAWEQPASTWLEVIDRYVSFVQVPAWRASVKRDGSERSPCLSAAPAHGLEMRMRRILEAVASRRGVQVKGLLAVKDDLLDLSRLAGREIPRADRCPAKLHWHFQRSYLLNAAGYRCEYCRRSAWDVYAEDTGKEPRRTLRFELDDRITRRRLDDPGRFDPENLVAACRSCNTIKAEMSEGRFLRELESLALGFVRSRGVGVAKTV
jgi:hypothetical protein